LICAVVGIGGAGGLAATTITDSSLQRLTLRLDSPASRGRLARGLPSGLMAGLVGGLAFGLGFGLGGSFSLAVQPTTVMRQSITYGLAGGLAVGLTAGLTIGLRFGLEVWIRYLIGCWIAHQQGKLPRRVGRFLDWAYRANLLRMAGTAAQFRHRELQDWLISATKDPSALTAQKEENKI
jgi:hypothetical protein